MMRPWLITAVLTVPGCGLFEMPQPLDQAPTAVSFEVIDGKRDETNKTAEPHCGQYGKQPNSSRSNLPTTHKNVPMGHRPMDASDEAYSHSARCGIF
jgi:hypothetical protein